MTLNLGGTISSTVKCGALAPSEGRDSSQFTKEYLNHCVDQILKSVKKERKVIVLTGTDTVGDFGDFLKTQIQCESCCIVLTAAMSPTHKDNAVEKAEGINSPGVHIVVTNTDGIAHTWDLNTVSIRKNGKELSLPFTDQELEPELNWDIPSLKKWQETYTVVYPEITDSAQEIAEKIKAAADTIKPILLVGYGFYNFPIHDECIKAALHIALNTHKILLATRTEAYMMNDCGDLMPYAPMKWLVDNGLTVLNTV